MIVAAPPEAGRLLVAARRILDAHAVAESRSADEDGYFVTGDDVGELAIHLYHRDADGERSRRDRLAVLCACAQFAGEGYTVTLVISPRTLLLHVRAP